ELVQEDFSAAVDHAQFAWQALAWIPWQSDLKGRAKEQLSAALQAKAAGDLHNFVEDLRFYDGQSLGNPALTKIARGCHKLWESRQVLMAGASTDSSARAADHQEKLRQDLLDLAIMSARLETKLATPAQMSAARSEAVERLQEARQTCGDSPALALALRDYSDGGEAGDVSIDSLPAAKSAWEHCVFGRWLLHHHAPSEARREFGAAVDSEPGNLWANFQLARAN